MQKIYISIQKETNVNYSIDNIINKKGYFNFKDEIQELIDLMPSTDKNIGEWIDELHNKIKKHKNCIFNDLFLKIKRGYGELSIEEIFATEKNEIKKKYHLSNIHQAKGKTFDAVLIILDKYGSRWSYETLLNKKIEENIVHEELRNIYVGITRPRKILHFIAHNSQKTAWERFLRGWQQMSLL